MLTPARFQWFSDVADTDVRFSEPMSRHTSLRAGGNAMIFASPRTEEALSLLMRRAAETGTPYRIIGGGTNLLIRENGFPGLLIAWKHRGGKITMTEIPDKDSCLLRVPATVRTAALCRFAVRNRLEGMMPLTGIPGTVGGAVVMNAGTSAGEISGTLVSVTVLTGAGEKILLKKDRLRFAYRRLIWPESVFSEKNENAPPALVEAAFRLRKSCRTAGQLQEEADRMLERRRDSQPLNFPSAGCFFKNPPGDSAGRLIDRAGLKGKSRGGACVSEKHGNFIINRGNASASDIFTLARTVRRTVADRFGVFLETEVEILG